MASNQVIKKLIWFSILFVFSISGCDNKKQSVENKKTIKVIVNKVSPQAVNIVTELPGRASAYRIAEIRPQVSGIILRRNFVEGKKVNAGDSLYQIDPASFRSVVDQSAAKLQQEQANAKLAASVLNRYQSLMGANYVSRQDYDVAKTQLQTARAAILSAQAALKSATIDLSRTEVRSPISGIVGISAVTEGALVQAGQSTSMVTVQQLDPMYIDITQSARDYIALKEKISNGIIKTSSNELPISVSVGDDRNFIIKGKLLFSDVTVDKTTGSITLRALVPNHDNKILPGMFIRAKLEQGTITQALVIPNSALIRSEQGDASVMILDNDNRAQSREVEVSQGPNNQWVVNKGLRAGETIITQGLQNIEPGIKVQPEFLAKSQTVEHAD